MRKLLFTSLVFLSAALLPCKIFAAANLMDVFHDALANDPTFQAAQAQYLADQEDLPIARSYLLPNVNIQGQTEREYVRETVAKFFSANGAPGSGSFYNTNNTYSLNISQPLFNYSAWYSVKNATYQVRQAEATFAGSAQDLMLRTAQAYFSVLQASDTLRYTLAQKRAVSEQLRQAQQQYEVGLIAITAASEAQANYDAVVAKEIAARNNLAVAMEQLRTITGKTYAQLMGANSDLPLVTPNPNNIDRWVYIAECQNYTLRASIEEANAAQQNIEVQRGGHFPVINATGSYTYFQDTNPAITGIGTQQTTAGGVTLNFPVYQGGLVTAQTEQANYLYQQAISNMEFTHRSVTQQARDAYLGVVTGINKIQADREAIVSAQIALKATREGYAAGTRTMLDVLNNQSSLYQAQINYSTDQYDYLTNILKLKQAAGTLSPSDLIEMNAWLRQGVDIAGKIANLDVYPLTPGTVAHPITNQNSKKTAPPLTLNKTEKQIMHEIKGGKITDKPKEKTAARKHAKKHTVSVAVLKHYYAIALFDTRYETHAEKFINDNKLTAKATYLKIKNAKGEMRYQVVYGVYPSIATAETAIKKLPPNLQNLHPWVKEINLK